MENWLREFIRALAKGCWRKDENIFVAQVNAIKVVYIPINPSKAEVVIRKMSGEVHERWPAVSPFYHVDPKDWTWVRQDAIRNALENGEGE